MLENEDDKDPHVQEASEFQPQDDDAQEPMENFSDHEGSATVVGSHVMYFSDDDNEHSGELSELLNRYVNIPEELCASSHNLG